MQRRADLVIGEPQIVGLHRHRMFEAGENEHSLGAALADESPSMLQLFEIVRGGRQDVAAGVGQVRREPIAKTIDAHPNLLVNDPEVTGMMARRWGKHNAGRHAGIGPPRCALTQAATSLSHTVGNRQRRGSGRGTWIEHGKA
jgi:hypothetical protein